MLDTTQKKVIVIVSFIFVAILIGFIIYFMFFRQMLVKPETSPTPPSTTDSAGTFPTSGEGGDPNIVDKQE